MEAREGTNTFVLMCAVVRAGVLSCCRACVPCVRAVVRVVRAVVRECVLSCVLPC